MTNSSKLESHAGEDLPLKHIIVDGGKVTGYRHEVVSKDWMEEPKTHRHCLDPEFTEHVIDSTGPNASPRMRQIIGPLIRHIHDFAKEIELTMDEFLAGVELVSKRRLDLKQALLSIVPQD